MTDSKKSKKKATKKKTAKKKVTNKKTELQPIENKEAIVQQSNNPVVAMIQTIERVALNPDVDVNKMEQLMNMQERMMDRNAELEFNKAMTRVQANLPVIPKDAYNEHTKSHYSRHETIVKAIKPVYTTEGFAISFSEAETPQSENKPKSIKIIGVLRHKDGHSEKYFTVLPIDTAGINGTVNKTGVHGTGSTITYGRRYLTCMIFDVATGDDTDGNLEPEVKIEYITEEQVNKLHSKITDHDLSMTGFTNWMKSELKINSFSGIPVNFYDHVDSRIDSAIRAQQPK